MVRIGFVGQRADLAVEVASLAMRSGASVQTLGGHEGRADGGALVPEPAVDLLLVDVDAVADHHLRHVPIWPGATVMICRPGEAERATLAADALRCSHVVELPTAAPWLEGQLAPPESSGLVGVLGVVGGAGATTAAIACAVGAGCECLLVDADPHSPGLDLPLGIDDTSGVRWAHIPDTSAPLDPESLRSALPQVAGCSVVTGPATDATAWVRGPSPGQCTGVLDVGRSHFKRTVVDVGRTRDPAELLGPADAVALVVPATLAGVVAARSTLPLLSARRVLVLVRPSPWLATAEVAAQVGVDEVMAIPRLRRAGELSDCGDLLAGRTGRSLRTFGRRVWERLA